MPLRELTVLFGLSAGDSPVQVPWSLTAAGLAVLFCLGAVAVLTRHCHDLLRRKDAELNQTKNLLRSMSAELERASLQILQAQEGERRFLARELHDEVGQSLTALKLLLHAAQSKESPESIHEAKNIASELLETVRQISLDLRPSMLDDLGLLPTLQWHLKRFTRQTGIQVFFQHSENLHRLPPDVEITAYRVIQEALNNIARHSGVDEARVEIRGTFGELWLKIEDHGRGFVPARSTPESSGLAGIRERIKLLHGDVKIESSLGSGTRISIRVPCDQPVSSPISA